MRRSRGAPGGPHVSLGEAPTPRRPSTTRSRCLPELLLQEPSGGPGAPGEGREHCLLAEGGGPEGREEGVWSHQGEMGAAETL